MVRTYRMEKKYIMYRKEKIMLRYGRSFTISQNLMDTIATYMNDDTREKVHFELAPCTPEEFLKRYIELDPDFEELLYKEFGIEMEEINENNPI